jgi:hypothetical protein
MIILKKDGTPRRPAHRKSIKISLLDLSVAQLKTLRSIATDEADLYAIDKMLEFHNATV